MKRHLIIGGSHLLAVGNSLRHAATIDNLSHDWLDYDAITNGPRWKRSFCWRFMNKRPPNLAGFNQRVLALCNQSHFDSIICAGNLSLTSSTLIQLADMGVLTSIWLTDDPWNPLHLSTRFLEALAHYGSIFTPRLANFDQLNTVAPQRVHYLPFGYDPRYFGPAAGDDFSHDVFFAGGADKERSIMMGHLFRSDLKVGLYGAYWDRFAETRGRSYGYAAPGQLNSFIASSRVSLCLVRRSNRDGHSMRTFEIGAAGVPMLAEDTDEHRSILGEDGSAALYFTNIDEMVEKCWWLIEHPEEAQKMGKRLGERIQKGSNTYTDRLREILSKIDSLS